MDADNEEHRELMKKIDCLSGKLSETRERMVSLETTLKTVERTRCASNERMINANVVAIMKMQSTIDKSMGKVAGIATACITAVNLIMLLIAYLQFKHTIAPELARLIVTKGGG